MGYLVVYWKGISVCRGFHRYDNAPGRFAQAERRSSDSKSDYLV